MQPQEVTDAAQRIAFLALTDPSTRPLQLHKIPELDRDKDKLPLSRQVRYYDAVGPETISMVEMLKRFAEFQGNNSFRPVFIDYRNMERVLNVKSLGNLNRQFVSLLRSEQGAAFGRRDRLASNPALAFRFSNTSGQAHGRASNEAGQANPS